MPKPPISPTGYSGTPLAQKLGLKPGYEIRLIEAPEYYRSLFASWPDDIKQLDANGGKKDFLHYFVTNAAALRQALTVLKKEMRPAACLWISWPKKAAKFPTDVDENLIREAALATGLVDVKVCAIDEKWSGLKLVIPVKQRTK